MKKFLAILTLVTITFPSFSTFAENTAVALCNSCSASAMQTKAIATAPDGGKVHVIDFNNALVKAYNIYREYNMATAVPASTDTGIDDAVQELKSAVELIEAIADGGIPYANIQPYMNAYQNTDSAHTVALRIKVKKELERALSRYFGSSVSGALATAVGALGLQVTSAVMPLNLTMKVVFTDGSTYTFEFKAIEVSINGEFIGLVIVAKVEGGEDEGITLADIATNGFDWYSASGSSAAIGRVLDTAIANGVTVSYNGYDGGSCESCSATIVDCTEFNGEMVCTASK